VHPAPSGQSYRERPPHPALSEYLSCVWVQRVAADAQPYPHRTVPNGSTEIACVVGSAPQVIGPQTGPTLDVHAPGTTVVGVRFRPGTAPSALGMPASELVDLAVASEELWGGAALALGEKVAQATTPGQAAALLEQEVLARLVDAPPPDPLVLAVVDELHPWRASEVTSLSTQLFVSERQLRRRCLAAVGLAPKAVQRMLRFQGFLALAHSHGLVDADLARLAAEAGYADQPHLTREALRLTGRTPKVLLQEMEEVCRATHDHSPSYGPLLRARGSAAA
jgi:AraC-like DNA-binding protein